MEKEMIDIFEKHNFVLVDINNYEGENIKIPSGRVVSPKWLARVLKKAIESSNQIKEGDK